MAPTCCIDVAMVRLGLSRSMVYKLLQRGRLKAVPIPGLKIGRRVTQESITRELERRVAERYFRD